MLRSLLLPSAVVLTLNFAFAPPALSGGDDSGPGDVHDDGPSYFGFVKDSNGKVIPDANVAAQIKGLGSVITHSDKAGAYKFPGFGRYVAPTSVTISCSKDGYRQVRAFNRTPLGKVPVVAIEIECTLERIGAK